MRNLFKKQVGQRIMIIKGDDGHVVKFNDGTVFHERGWFTSIFFWPKSTRFTICVRTVLNDHGDHVIVICKRDEHTVYTGTQDLQDLLRSSGWLFCDFSYKRNETERGMMSQWKEILDRPRHAFNALLEQCRNSGGWHFCIQKI